MLEIELGLVGLRAANQFAEHFTCRDNPDPKHRWCETPQELPDDEIDRQLGLAPREHDLVEEDGNIRDAEVVAARTEALGVVTIGLEVVCPVVLEANLGRPVRPLVAIGEAVRLL